MNLEVAECSLFLLLLLTAAEQNHSRLQRATYFWHRWSANKQSKQAWRQDNSLSSTNWLKKRVQHLFRFLSNTFNCCNFIKKSFTEYLQQHPLISPSVISFPNTRARAPDAPMQCSSECCRRLWLMNAASTPIIARPNHRATSEGWLSMYKATTSPSVQPCASAQWATAWHRCWSSLKLQTWRKIIAEILWVNFPLFKKRKIKISKILFEHPFILDSPHLSCGLVDQSWFIWVLHHRLGKQSRDGASILLITTHGKPHLHNYNQTPFGQKRVEEDDSRKVSNKNSVGNV